MDEETRKYIEDGKLLMNDSKLDAKEALMTLKEFVEEETAKCVWCGDEFPIDELHREKDMGYLCDNCKRGIESRGEELEFEDEYSDTRHRRDESLNESSMLIDEFSISDSESLRVYWDKYEGYTVEKLYRQGDEIWKTVSKRTFPDEASAKRYFSRAKRKFGVNESVDKNISHIYLVNSEDGDVLYKTWTLDDAIDWANDQNASLGFNNAVSVEEYVCDDKDEIDFYSPSVTVWKADDSLYESVEDKSVLNSKNK